MNRHATPGKVVAFLLTGLLILLSGLPPAATSVQAALPAQGLRPAGGGPPPCSQFGGAPSAGSPADLRPGPARRPGRPGPGSALRARASAPAAPTGVRIGDWTNLYPRLMAISALTPTDAWAVGEYGHLLHYTGTWAAVDSPELRGHDLTDIKMLSPTSGWIAAGATAFEYDGTVWRERSRGLEANHPLARVAPLAADNVWGITSLSVTGAYSTTLVHWDGTTWNTVLGPPANAQLRDLTMVSPTEGWAVGSDYDHGLLLHYDGTSWRLLGYSGQNLLAVAAPVPGTVWYTGYLSYTDPSGIVCRSGRLGHYTLGGSSTSYRLYSDEIADSIYMASATEGWVNANSGILHFDSTGQTPEPIEGYALRLGGSGAQLWAIGALDAVQRRTTDATWVQEYGEPASRFFYTISTAGADDAWAASADGLYHYTGGAWQFYTDTQSLGLIVGKLQMVSPSEGYAIGQDGILRWDGSRWHRVVRSKSGLLGLAMAWGGNGWVVGEDGSIWQAHDNAWNQVASPVGTAALLKDVALDSPTHGWAIGVSTYYRTNESPLLLEYTAGHWVDRSSRIPAGIAVLWDLTLLPDTTDGWIIGGPAYNPVLLALHNGVLTVESRVSGPTGAPGRALAVDANGTAWAANINETIYHYTGGDWRLEPLPSNDSLNIISLLPGRGGWALGLYGGVLRYQPLPAGQEFADVPITNPFYTFINHLAGLGIVAADSSGNFQPFADANRVTLADWVVRAKGWAADTHGGPHFTDVPPTDPYYAAVETAFNHGVLSGYADHTFRPAALVTRGQMSKMIVNALGWTIDTSTGIYFRDVDRGNPFYGPISTIFAHGLVSGYDCGPGCHEFRWGNNNTRGQLAKVLANALQ